MINPFYNLRKVRGNMLERLSSLFFKNKVIQKLNITGYYANYFRKTIINCILYVIYAIFNHI